MERDDWNDHRTRELYTYHFLRDSNLVKHFNAQVVDIGVGPFSVTHSRSKAIDFSVAFYEEPTAILIPPPAEDNRLLACIKPFRLEVILQ